jgi:hypothetical protein
MLRGLYAQMPVDDRAIALCLDGNAKAEPLDSSGDLLDGVVVLSRVACVGYEFIKWQCYGFHKWL